MTIRTHAKPAKKMPQPAAISPTDSTTNCAPLDTKKFDALVEKARSAADKYLTGWKEHAQFTGYSVGFLKKVTRAHPDIPIGDLAGRPFSDKAALLAWLDRLANPDRYKSM